MNKIKIIVIREFLSRVRKKSFIIMTLIGPILLASVIIIPVYLARIASEPQTIGVIDETGFFYETLIKHSSEKIKFTPIFDGIDFTRANFEKFKINAVLYIPQGAISSPSTIKIFSEKQVGITVITFIETILQKEIEANKLAVSGIDKSIIEDIRTPVRIQSIVIKDGIEQESNIEIAMVLSLISAIVIYIFIFSYGSLVMRSVIEEKTNRIVEIIVSSVRPFQLMMGKIIGVALVGLLQFLLWIFLTFVIVTAFQISKPEFFKLQEEPTVLLKNKGLSATELNDLQNFNKYHSDASNKILLGIKAINFDVIILMFLFYFIFGYLMYGAIFAAIGSAVDNEADTQQFMLPITAPLIISIIMLQFLIENPYSSVSFWLSIIPLTSPVIMMARIPFNPPIIDVVISMVLLLITFVFVTWLAAKIYRTGILMYGKKTNYKELWKWLKY